jgi:hypothetical protein
LKKGWRNMLQIEDLRPSSGFDQTPALPNPNAAKAEKLQSLNVKAGHRLSSAEVKL